MFYKISLIVVFFTIGLMMGYALRYGQESEKTFICQFANMTQKFEATQRQSAGSSPMITVHQGSRTFMFRRDNLTSCYSSEEDNDTID